MKKIILILSLISWINLTFSQEVKSVYIFKKEVKKRSLTKYELDSLVLYKDGSFYRKEHYIYHEVSQQETKGIWKIENGTLILNVIEKKDEIWANFTDKYTFTLNRKRLILINILSKRKLKLLK